MSLQYNLPKTQDTAQGLLDSSISASDPTIQLQSGDGANFPETFNGTTTSGGSSTILNKTGIGALEISPGDFIENLTDGSHAFVKAVNADSLETTTLLGGSNNTWQNGDEYLVNSFDVTLNKRDSNGNITASEIARIKTRSGDTLTVFPGGRGYSGSTAQAWDVSTPTYVNIFVTSGRQEMLRLALAQAYEQLDLKATIAYVNALLGQQNWKPSVKCATTVAGDLATDFEDGSVVDGITLVTGDRILIKNQANPAENGIYVVNASGAPTRATDFDSGPEATSAVIPVEQGTSNADTVWVCTNDNPTIGTDSINFTILTQVLIKASLAEAQAGTDDTKYMTPYLVREAIAAIGDIEDGVLGDTISSDDMTNNRNLVYRKPSDMKWYKVTNDPTTWYYRLGLVLESGSANDTKKIMTRGIYGNQNFADINPTFSGSATGTDYNVGDTAANSARALRISNLANGEAVVSGGQIRAKQVGTPSGAMLIYLVLEQQEQTLYPAAFKDTGNVMRGAIIASATIAQAGFSGSYQNMPFSFGSNIRIPAGARVYLVVAKAGAVNGSNHYVIDGDVAGTGMITLDQSTMAWSNGINPTTGNYSLTTVSTSPVGYTVKAFVDPTGPNGAGINGSYGLTPVNPWSRVIARIINSTSFYFDPNEKIRKNEAFNFNLVANAASGYYEANLGFCPSHLSMVMAVRINATPPVMRQNHGFVRPGVGSIATGVYGAGTSGGQPDDFLGNAISNSLNTAQVSCGVNQNRIYAVRMESGVRVYCGYPGNTNFISSNQSGFTSSNVTFLIDAE